MSTAARPNASPGWSWATRPCAARPARPGAARLPHRHEHHLRDIRGRTARPLPPPGASPSARSRPVPATHGGAREDQARPDLRAASRARPFTSPTPSTRSPRTATPGTPTATRSSPTPGPSTSLPGMLIYCQRDGDAPPTAIPVGMHRTRLDTWALTLSGTPADIEHRLKDLANRIVERPTSDCRLRRHEPRSDRDRPEGFRCCGPFIWKRRHREPPQ